jgi:hypothetical protein
VANGTRTRDHRDHNPGLYQLSYRHRARTWYPGISQALYEAVVLSRRARVDAFAEFLDHLFAERGQVIGLARRYEPVIDDDFPVDPAPR